jgi:regulator of cell morphogenesis and NO signaling
MTGVIWVGFDRRDNCPAGAILPRPENRFKDPMTQTQLAMFDRLQPGETVRLRPERPSDLLATLQQERKGQFEWSPVSEDPGGVMVDVFRRNAERGARREVNEALAWDHDRLDALEKGAFEARANGDFDEAGAIYAMFACGLRRHIRFEEEILFPAFETRAGFSAETGPTAVMRDEHQEILRCIGRIEAGIKDQGANVDTPRHTLHTVLGNHNLKEENIVYPLTDQALTADERDALVARIQAL